MHVIWRCVIALLCFDSQFVVRSDERRNGRTGSNIWSIAFRGNKLEIQRRWSIRGNVEDDVVAFAVAAGDAADMFRHGGRDNTQCKATVEQFRVVIARNIETIPNRQGWHQIGVLIKRRSAAGKLHVVPKVARYLWYS